MKFKLLDAKDEQLKLFKVNAKDREYQFWERNSLSTDLWSEAMFKILCSHIGLLLNILKIINILLQSFFIQVLMILVFYPITWAEVLAFPWMF